MSLPDDFVGQVLSRSLASIVYGGWTPNELFLMQANTGAVARAHATVPTTGGPKFAPHIILDPQFEALQLMSSPQLEGMCTNEQAIKLLRSDNARILATEIGLAPHTTTFSEKLSKILDPLQLFSSVTTQDSQGVEIHFRIITETGIRRFSVERAQSHVFLLMQALVFSFPELLIPVVRAHHAIECYHVDMLLQCLISNMDLLVGYFPFLFFLFEESTRDFVSFCNGIPDSIRQQQQQEEAPFTAPASLTKTMFSMFKKAQSPETPTPRVEEYDIITFSTANPSLFPDGFQSWYESAQSVLAVASELPPASSSLATAIEAEMDALEELVNAIERSDFVKQSLPSFLCDDEIQWTKEEQQLSPIPICKSVSDFLEIVSSHQLNVTLPLTNLLVVSSGLFHLHADSAVVYAARQTLLVKQYLERKKRCGKKPECLDAVEKKAEQIQETCLRFKDETTRARMHSRRALLQMCVHVASVIHHLADPYDPRHHGGKRREPSMDRSPGNENAHPVLGRLVLGPPPFGPRDAEWSSECEPAEAVAANSDQQEQ